MEEAVTKNGAMHKSSRKGSINHRATKARDRERRARSSRRAPRVAIAATTSAPTQRLSVLQANDDDDNEVSHTKSFADLKRNQQDDGITSVPVRHVTSDVTGTPPRHSTPVRASSATASAPNLSGILVLCSTC